MTSAEMYWQDCHKDSSLSDSSESSGVWVLVSDANTNQNMLKSRSEMSSENSESDEISIISDCEEVDEGPNVTDQNETAYGNTEPGTRSSQIESDHEVPPNEFLDEDDENLQITTLSADGTLHGEQYKEESRNFVYFSGTFIAIVIIAIILSPLSAKFLNLIDQDKNSLENFSENENSNNDCPKISEFCLAKYISNVETQPNLQNAKDTFLLSLNSKLLPENSKEFVETKKTKVKSKNKEQPSKSDKNKHEKLTKHIPPGNTDKEYDQFMSKIKKKQKKLKEKSKFIRQKEKYLEAKEKELFKLEKEIKKRSAKIKDFFRKEEKRRHHHDIKQNIKKNISQNFKHSNFKKQHFEKRQNQTVSGYWYDQLHNARDKIRKEERRSEWIFDLHNYRDMKRKENKKKSQWMNFYYRSHFKR